MIKPHVLIFSGYGLNCEEETKYAFELAGARVNIVHINDLIENPRKLNTYQIAVFPGGFSYGDDTGSGKAYANKLKNNLWNELMQFITCDTLTLGICNGFQIITNLGLVPALNKSYGTVEVALTTNDSARYKVRWVDVRVTNNSPWLKNISTLSLPIAHGEGKLVASSQTLERMKKNNCIALTYTQGEMCDHFDLTVNPNGSLHNIAGLTDESGRVLGMMPHPERALFFTQLPHWTYLKEQLMRARKKIPSHNKSLLIFKNAVNYFAS